MQGYNTKEASEILGIPERTLVRKCAKLNIRKRSGAYYITEVVLNEWKEELLNSSRLKTILKTSEVEKQIDVTHSELEQKNAELEKTVKKLKSSLKQFKIEPNERIEVFTEEDYKLFESRLIEWKEQRNQLDHQEELFNVKLASKEELVQHYQNQFEYQKKQSERILEMHQKLIDTIQEQTKSIVQRNIIEAKEKEVIDEDWKPKKKPKS
jgi:hypothetical protein